MTMYYEDKEAQWARYDAAKRYGIDAEQLFRCSDGIYRSSADAIEFEQADDLRRKASLRLVDAGEEGK